MNFLYCSAVILMVVCTASSRHWSKIVYPTSCKHIKNDLPRSSSGLYDILIDNRVLTVYCEMDKHGGGFTFIPRNAVQKPTKYPSLVPQLCTDPTQVLLCFRTKNCLQSCTLIKQLSTAPNAYLGVKMNEYTGYKKPQNNIMGEYLYLGILKAHDARHRNRQGFRSNNKDIAFRNCDANPNSYFVFYPNHRQQAISNYHGRNLVYERRGVAVDWRKTGVPSYGHRQMPNDFFFLTEMHFGGCGTYTSSDRWTDSCGPYGTAIGLR